VYTEFWLGNWRKRHHLEDPGLDRKITLRCIFRTWDVRVWIGTIWLRIGNTVTNLRVP